MIIKNLNFQYAKKDRWIFKDFNWRLDPVKVHFIIGGNGVGKTTFYEIITSLLDYEGSIENKINWKDILLQLQGVPMLASMKGKNLADLLFGADGGFGDISLENIKKNLNLESQQN